MQRLQEFRLQRAHAMLRQADDGTRVADVALDCGFAHFGRFAQAYRQQFGDPGAAATLNQRSDRAHSIRPAL